jgi:hypothetical protein
MDEENVFIYNGVLLSIKKNAIAGCWLLTPVILSQGLLFKANSGK